MIFLPSEGSTSASKRAMRLRRSSRDVEEALGGAEAAVEGANEAGVLARRVSASLLVDGEAELAVEPGVVSVAGTGGEEDDGGERAAEAPLDLLLLRECR